MTERAMPSVIATANIQTKASPVKFITENETVSTVANRSSATGIKSMASLPISSSSDTNSKPSARSISMMRGRAARVSERLPPASCSNTVFPSPAKASRRTPSTISSTPFPSQSRGSIGVPTVIYPAALNCTRGAASSLFCGSESSAKGARNRTVL